MKNLMMITFVVALAKSGLWITGGLLVKKHLVALFPSIDDKPEEESSINTLAKWMGIIMIIIGAFALLMAITPLIMGFRMPMGNMNFKF